MKDCLVLYHFTVVSLQNWINAELIHTCRYNSQYCFKWLDNLHLTSDRVLEQSKLPTFKATFCDIKELHSLFFHQGQVPTSIFAFIECYLDQSWKCIQATFIIKPYFNLKYFHDTVEIGHFFIPLLSFVACAIVINVFKEKIILPPVKFLLCSQLVLCSHLHVRQRQTEAATTSHELTAGVLKQISDLAD